MPTYGLTDAGFVVKTFEIIKAEIEAAWRGAFGESLDLSPATPDGQVIAIFAERETLLWELAEVLAGMMDPDKVSGALQDALCKITGTYRDPAAPSLVTLTLTGDAATEVPAGSRAATESEPVKTFETQATATLVALDAFASTTPYAVGDRVTNVTPTDRAYVCITAGTSDVTGPTTTADDITDGTVHWRYMGEGVAAVDVLAACTETGPTIAVSGDITEIETAVSGWESVINLEDADPGTNLMSDQGLRLLRDAELAATGTSSVPAIRRTLLKVDDVEAVTVFYNNSDATDGDGMPPHSVEALVQGGDDDDIFAAMFRATAGGIVTHGTEVGTVTDSQGTDHTVKFSRPDEVEIYIAITVEVDPDTVQADVQDQIKAAIVAWGLLQPNGRDARSSLISAQAFYDTSILGVTSCLIDDAPGPISSATVPISLRQRATYDTSRISVTVVEVTP